MMKMCSEKFQITPGISDEEFIRTQVPMTKEEVRAVSICKLHLHKDAVVYDVGGGTGSVSVEIARLSPSISLFSIESNPEAVDLIKQNVEKFNLTNVKVVSALAPEGLDNLPSPTHAFIGGTKGNLKPVLEALKSKNSAVRVVINAVSLDSISEIYEVLKEFSVCNEEIIQLSVSKAKKAGNHQLLTANNPVFIFSFDLG